MNKFHSIIAVATFILFLLGTPLEIRSEYIVSKNNLTDPPLPPKVIYDELICPDDPAEMKLYLSEREPGVTYEWVIHQMYDTLTSISQNEDTVYVSDVRELSPIFPIVILARNDRGITPKPLIIKSVKPFDFPKIEPDTICTGDVYFILPFANRKVDCYSWDLAGAQLVDGDTTSGDPFEISFDSAGLKKYSVIITDIEGCEHRKSYELYVFEDPPSPQIQCTSLTDVVLYSWTEDPDFTYELDFSKMPSQLTIESTGPNEIMVTDFTSPCMYALLGVEVFDASPAPCDMISQTVPCRPSPSVTISINNVPPQDIFCEGEENPVVQIEVIVNGVSNPSGGEWVSPSQGFLFTGNVAMFDPNGLPAGFYGADYWYTNPVNGCVEFSNVRYEIKSKPLIDVVVDKDAICFGEEVTLSFDRGEGVPLDVVVTPSVSGLEIESTCNGNKKITFPELEQTYEIMVTSQEPYCIPVMELVSVQVMGKEDLDLECSSFEVGTITLEWMDIASVYDIHINGSLVSTGLDNNFIVIDSIETGPAFEYVVSAIDPNCYNGIIADTIYCAPLSSTKEHEKGNLRIFPNPAKEVLVIHSNLTYKSPAILYNSSRKVIDEINITAGINELNILGLSSGLYLLQIMDKNDLEIHQFVKLD